MKELLGRNVEKIGINADLMKALGLDSFGAVELIVSIKRKGSVDLSEQEIEESKTVGNLISMLTPRSRGYGAQSSCNRGAIPISRFRNINPGELS